MKPLEAAAEDLRRLGVAAIITGLVGGFLEDNVPSMAAVISAVLGILFLAAGYWAHHKTEKPQ